MTLGSYSTGDSHINIQYNSRNFLLEDSVLSKENYSGVVIKNYR